jgi:hypothetical protein
MVAGAEKEVPVVESVTETVQDEAEEGAVPRMRNGPEAALRMGDGRREGSNDQGVSAEAWRVRETRRERGLRRQRKAPPPRGGTAARE